MSLIATAVKHLLAAGVTGDALLTAIAELEAEITAASPVTADTAAERRREKDRAYQAARRADRRQNLPTSADSADVVDHADVASLPRLPNENKSNPSTPTHPEGTTGAADAGTHEAVPADPAQAPKPAKPTKAKRQSAAEVAMPEGWEPLLTPAARSIVDGWPPGMLDLERMGFEAHAASTGRVTKDWQAAFRTWITKAERQRLQNGNRSAGTGRVFAGTHQPDRRDGFTRSLDDAIERGRAGSTPLQ